MTDYFNPKVVSAAVSVLIAAAVAAAVDLLGVSFITAEMVWGVLIGGSVATGAAYAKGDGRTYGRSGDRGHIDPLYLLVVVILVVILILLLRPAL